MLPERPALRAPALRRIAVSILVSGAPVLLAACRTTKLETPAGWREVNATRATLVQSFEVRVPDVLVGHVLRYSSDEDPPRTFFLVQNEQRQDLGLVDALGRAGRYRPHEREPEWLTTGTVLQGARAILGVGSEAVLVDRGRDAQADQRP